VVKKLCSQVLPRYSIFPSDCQWDLIGGVSTNDDEALLSLNDSSNRQEFELFSDLSHVQFAF
jgi:hypothetical protein